VTINTIDGIDLPSSSTPKAADSIVETGKPEQVRPSTTNKTGNPRARARDEFLRQKNQTALNVTDGFKFGKAEEPRIPERTPVLAKLDTIDMMEEQFTSIVDRK